MSHSKVLNALWGEVKVNFEAFLNKVKKEDKLPSHQELVKHQEMVKDIIDIFATASGSSSRANAPKTGKSASVEEGSRRGSDRDTKEPSSEQEKVRKKRKLFTEEENNYLWKMYVNNHMQYPPTSHIKAATEKLDRNNNIVHKKLKSLIAAHRGVPLEQALDNAFTAEEDARVWDAYTSRASGSAHSEGRVVEALAKELHRPAEEVQNRLLWLKEQKSTIGTDSTKSKATGAATDTKAKHHKQRPYSDEENATILQVCEDETMTHEELANHLGRGKKSVLQQYLYLKHTNEVLDEEAEWQDEVEQGSGSEVEQGGAAAVKAEAEESSDLGSGVKLVKVKTEPGLPKAATNTTYTTNTTGTVPAKRPHPTHSISYTATTTTTTITNTTNTTTTTTTNPPPYSHASWTYGQRYSPQEDEIIAQALLHPFRTSLQRFEEVGRLLGRSGSAVQRHVKKLYEDRYGGNGGSGDGVSSGGASDGEEGSGSSGDVGGASNFSNDRNTTKMEGVYSTYSISLNDTVNTTTNTSTNTTLHTNTNTNTNTIAYTSVYTMPSYTHYSTTNTSDRGSDNTNTRDSDRTGAAHCYDRGSYGRGSSDDYRGSGDSYRPYRDRSWDRANSRGTSASNNYHTDVYDRYGGSVDTRNNTASDTYGKHDTSNTKNTTNAVEWMDRKSANTSYHNTATYDSNSHYSSKYSKTDCYTTTNPSNTSSYDSRRYSDNPTTAPSYDRYSTARSYTTSESTNNSTNNDSNNNSHYTHSARSAPTTYSTADYGNRTTAPRSDVATNNTNTTNTTTTPFTPYSNNTPTNSHSAHSYSPPATTSATVHTNHRGAGTTSTNTSTNTTNTTNTINTTNTTTTLNTAPDSIKKRKRAADFFEM